MIEWRGRKVARIAAMVVALERVFARSLCDLKQGEQEHM
jgi:hypothetical protein